MTTPTTPTTPSTPTTPTTPTTPSVPDEAAPRPLDLERANLLASLAHARAFLSLTVRQLSTEQASQRTTISALTLGGLIKHVTGVETGWAAFLTEGAGALGGGKAYTDWTEEDYARREQEFRMQPGETLEGVLAAYEAAAARTDAVIRALDSLDVVHELPPAPWDGDSRWSRRRAVLHIIAETAQHAGHADILRESLDGATSMA